jgi:hypothetical protein
MTKRDEERHAAAIEHIKNVQDGAAIAADEVARDHIDLEAHAYQMRSMRWEQWGRHRVHVDGEPEAIRVAVAAAETVYVAIKAYKYAVNAIPNKPKRRDNT